MIVSILLALGVAGLVAQDDGGPKLERAGKHYRIVFHHADLEAELAGALADTALARAEAMWPLLKKLVLAKGREVHTIHLYRDPNVYEEMRSLNPMRVEMEGFVARGGEAHVGLEPKLRPYLLAITGLPDFTADAIALVAADQVVHPLVPPEDRGGWMRWAVVMGAVEILTNPKREFGVNSGYDRRRTPFIQRRREGRGFNLLDLRTFDFPPKDEDDWYWVKAYSAWLAELCEGSTSRWARKLLKGKHRVAKGHNHTAHWRHSAMVAVLGKDLSKAELRLGRLIQDAKLRWRIAAPGFQRDGDRFLFAAGDSPASVWHFDPLPDLDYFMRGRLQFGPKPGGPLQLIFGWNKKTSVGVFFAEDSAEIATWNVDTLKWTSMAKVNPQIPKGESFDFYVELDRSRLRVGVNGEEVCTWRHNSRDMHGTVRLQVIDTLVWIKDFEVGSLEIGRKK